MREARKATRLDICTAHTQVVPGGLWPVFRRLPAGEVKVKNTAPEKTPRRTKSPACILIVCKRP